MIRIAKLSLVVFLFALSSCYNEEVFSDVPFIEFRSLEFVDSSSDTLILKFHFEDGGANLGFPSNDFSSPYFLYVDSEPKILTERNIGDALLPVSLASFFIENVELLRRNNNVFTLIPNSAIYPAILNENVSITDLDEIVFECPNIINQDSALFGAANLRLYRENQPDTLREVFFYEEILEQNIESEVPAIYRETFYNIIVRFQRILNGAPEVDENGEDVYIDFGEVFDETDCGIGVESFNARVPIFDQDGRSGTITYNIVSILLRQGIGDDPFQIRFFVYDRAGSKSNEVVSPTFRLSDITRN